MLPLTAEVDARLEKAVRAMELETRLEGSAAWPGRRGGFVRREIGPQNGTDIARGRRAGVGTPAWPGVPVGPFAGFYAARCCQMTLRRYVTDGEALAAGQYVPIELTFNRRVPRPERVEESLERVKREPREMGATEWTFAKEIVLLDALLQKEPTKDVEVQAIQLGPAVFVTNPAELFCQSGA